MEARRPRELRGVAEPVAHVVGPVGVRAEHDGDANKEQNNPKSLAQNL